MSVTFTFTEIADDHMRQRGLSIYDMLGTVPDMISATDQADAVTQIDRAYRDAGGGWRDSTGASVDVERRLLTFPGDPARQLVAFAELRAEKILFFDGAWVAVVQPDGSSRIARID